MSQILKLIIWPDEILKIPSVAVDSNIDDNILHIVDNMFEVMYHYKGVGLSAVQIGLPLRIVVMDCRATSNFQQNIEPKPLVLINPEITEFIGTPSMVKEGCLSFPGVIEDAIRYPEIIIKAQNLEEEFVTYQMAGLEAQCAQHEIEHLDGKTFDKGWGRTKRDIVKRKIFKARYL